MFDNKLNYKIINITFLVILLYVLVNSVSLWIGIISKIINILGPFIIGFVFAYAFTPLVRYLVKKGLKRKMAITIVVVGLVILVGLLLAFTLPLLYDQLSLLVKMVVEIMNDLGTKYDLNLGKYSIKITDYLNEIVKEVGTFASSTGMDLINKSIGFVTQFIIGFVGFTYFLIYMDSIRDSIKELLLTSKNKKWYSYFHLMDGEITNYLKGLEIFMIIQYVEYSLLFLIVGHPNWLILGILACVTTVIPYFGGLITNVIAIILACVVSPKLVVLTIIICLIFPQIDGYFISPRIYGKTTNVNPLIVIMAVSVGGRLAGIPGIIAALPCYLVLRTTYNFFKKDLKKGMVTIKKTI